MAKDASNKSEFTRLMGLFIISNIMFYDPKVNYMDLINVLQNRGTGI
jgi:hypothetical protein